jgi:hypothetical protein
MPGFYTRAMAQAQFVLTRTRTRNPKDLGFGKYAIRKTIAY